MTKYEKFVNKDIDSLAEWLDKYAFFEESPWIKWWDDKYCKQCDGVFFLDDDGIKRECAWCELNGKCKYFQDMDDIPDCKQIIKLWLMSQEDE